MKDELDILVMVLSVIAAIVGMMLGVWVSNRWHR